MPAQPNLYSEFNKLFYLNANVGSVLLLVIVLLTTGCQSYNVRYEPPLIETPEIKDSGPTTSLIVDHIPDAIPVVEPRIKSGNKSPYSVNGKTYHLIENTSGFTQVGYASWYGNKFHGQRTSNGELYDMYGMTAAHKTLPIPTFVELTNLANGRKVVVRVNDRGPFHGDRIIDLTYTAAQKLGFASAGTGRVSLKVLDPDGSQVYQGLAAIKPNEVLHTIVNGVAPAPRNSGGYELPENTYLQLAAFGSQASALAFKARAQQLTSYTVSLEAVPQKNIFRVLLGPLKDNWDLVHTQLHFVKNGFQEPKIAHR